MAPAFKEWHVIVEALGAGAQVIILRKGGLAEGRGGFQLAAHRFWLFPTHFHAQREKTKSAAAAFYYPPAENPLSSVVPLQWFAELVDARFVSDWDTVRALDSHHLWTEATVRERFDWAKPPGLHVLLVRIHRLERMTSLSVTPELAGCKSWIELPHAFDAQPSTPVLNDEAFAAAAAPVRAVLGM